MSIDINHTGRFDFQFKCSVSGKCIFLWAVSDSNLSFGFLDPKNGILSPQFSAAQVPSVDSMANFAILILPDESFIIAQSSDTTVFGQKYNSTGFLVYPSASCTQYLSVGRTVCGPVIDCSLYNGSDCIAWKVPKNRFFFLQHK